MSDSPMQRALAQARAAVERGEVPVGAVIVDSAGKIVAEAGNEVESAKDATLHAELLALRRAMAALGEKTLGTCDLYVTLEPCAMCAGALAHARIRRIYYAAPDPKGGAIEHGPCFFSQPTCHHKPEIYGGIEEDAATQLLKSFFADVRKKKSRDVAG